MINFSDIGLRDNVAQILVLQDAGDYIPITCWPSVCVHCGIEAVLVYLLYADVEGQLVVIANTHILFNPKRGDIKVPIDDHACKNPPLSLPLSTGV